MMDIYNNNQGIAFGVTATNHSNQMVANTIMQLLVIGELKYISTLDFDQSKNYPVGLNGILDSSTLIPTNQ